MFLGCIKPLKVFKHQKLKSKMKKKHTIGENK